MAKVMLLIYLGIKGELSVALWSAERGIKSSKTFRAGNEQEFEAAVLSYLDAEGAPFIAAAAISAPGWEQGGIQYMPNHGYDLDRDWLRKILNIQRVHIVNPTVARALSIPHLDDRDMRVLCSGSMDSDDMTKCILGTGPGLGMAILFKDNDEQWTAFSGPGGHTDLAVSDEREFGVLKRLREKYGHVSRERAVSLGGLCDIWMCLADIDGQKPKGQLEFEEVVSQANSGNKLTQEAVDLCLKWLAKAASDIVLFSGARGGVYLTGQLVEALLDHIDKDTFQAHFTKNGPIGSYLEAVPVNIITSREADFKGLVTLFH